MSREYILAINPGSTSTKVALFRGVDNIVQSNLSHSPEDIGRYERIVDQFEMRKSVILDWIESEGFSLDDISAVVGRGGLLAPIPGGTYSVTDHMIKDLEEGQRGEHASNLGGIIARAIADMTSVPSFIVDPVAVDEFDEVARISGMPEIERRSQGHALNIKAVGRKVASQLGKRFEDINMVIAHLGGGISVAPVRKGRNIDYNNANEMGPFSPERTGGLPVGDLVKMCYSGEYTLSQMKQKIKGKGGLVAYLGTNDARKVIEKIDQGDERARLVFEAMGYQIGKEIGAMATAVMGDVEAVVITGGLAHSKLLVEYIKEMVQFIAPVIVVAGEDEMEALNAGALRVMNGQEQSKIYEDEVK